MATGFIGELTPQPSRDSTNYTIAPSPLLTDEAPQKVDSDQLTDALGGLKINDAVGNDAVGM